MDPNSKEAIIKNIFRLVLHTTCSRSFLEYFMEEKILDEDHVSKITSHTTGDLARIKQTLHFYEFLLKSDAAEVVSALKNALRESKQEAALNALNGIETDEPDSAMTCHFVGVSFESFSNL